MSVKIIYFVHGTTDDNEKGLASGQADVELSALGIKQAEKLGELIKGNFAEIFCSDLKRSIDSGRLAFGHKYEIILDKRLREIDYGTFTQKPDNFKNDLPKYIETPFPSGESYLDVEKRIKSFLDFLKNNYAGQTVGVVAHQAPQLALEVLLNHKTWAQAIAQDWRKTKAWQPGWEYLIN